VNTRIRRAHLVGATAVALVGACTGAALSQGDSEPTAAGATEHGTRRAKVVPLKDARLKFEINATDRDGGVQVFIDADSWKEISIFDPSGAKILTTTTTGRMAKQGGTELFLESAEPPFTRLPVAKLLQRFPKGKYAVRGTGVAGERYVGSAILTHNLPAGPELVSPVKGHGPQLPNDTSVVWKPVAPPNGSPIIGYQVLVVRPDTGLRALPKVTLDATMPPTATSLKIPPGFLEPNTEYEWEVLAIEKGGNQTLSSATFTTAS
jgi:hypothetical protein